MNVYQGLVRLDGCFLGIKRQNPESVDLLVLTLVARHGKPSTHKAPVYKHSPRKPTAFFLYNLTLFDVCNWILPVFFLALIEISIPLITLHIAVDIAVDITAVQIGL